MHRPWESAREPQARSGAQSPAFTAGIAGCVLFGALTIFYAIGMTLESGKRVAEFDLKSGGGSPSAVFQERPSSRRLGPLALDSTMNPVRLLLHVSFRGREAGDAVTVNVALRDPRGRAMWSDSRTLPWSTHRHSSTFSSTSAALVTLDVPRAGDYAIEYSLRMPARNVVERAWLEVRRDVLEPNSWILWGGGLAAFTSLLAGLFGSVLRREPPGAERLAA
jgi:hypothetical protein